MYTMLLQTSVLHTLSGCNLPMKYGGLGVRQVAAAAIALPSFLASAASTFQLQVSIGVFSGLLLNDDEVSWLTFLGTPSFIRSIVTKTVNLGLSCHL